MIRVDRANFSKVCGGTAMVELAIILPLMLFILFGITELGRALYQQNILTQAVELGGRYMARVDGAVDKDSCVKVTNDGSGNDVWASAETVAKNLIRCGVDGAACDPPVVPNLEIANIHIEVCGSGTEVAPCTLPSPPACVIAVKATANFQSIFGSNLISVPGYSLGVVTLNATTQERYIGY